MSAVAFFRLKCDGGCERWLSDVVGRNVPKLTSVRSRALTFLDAEEALETSATVGWTKCRCTTPDSTRHRLDCEVAEGVSLCGNCRARKEKERREQS